MNKTAMRFFLWPRFPMSNTAAATGNGTPANQDRRSMHAKKSPSWLCAAHSLTCTGGHLRELCRGSDVVCNCIQNRACCKHETSRTFHGRPEAHICISGTPGPQASAPHHPPWSNVASEATEAVAPAKARRRRTRRKQGQRPWAIFLREAATTAADKGCCRARTRQLRPR